MIPPKRNFVDIALKMFLAEIIENTMFYTFKLNVERFRRVVVNVISRKFLLLMESVFSGMARAVIHNSNYDSAEECKSSIDRYFLERNLHYMNNPKRAGDKIWGKERVAPVFKPSNNCKDPLYQ